MIGMDPDTNIIMHSKETYESALDRLEEELQGKPYVCGPEITLADLSLVMDVYHLTVFYDYEQWP
jgi:glutathione S-transferase